MGTMEITEQRYHMGWSIGVYLFGITQIPINLLHAKVKKFFLRIIYLNERKPHHVRIYLIYLCKHDQVTLYGRKLQITKSKLKVLNTESSNSFLESRSTIKCKLSNATSVLQSLLILLGISLELEPKELPIEQGDCYHL